MTKKIYLETFKKCPGSLCFPLLRYPFCNKESSFKWDLLAKQIEKNGLHDSNSSQNVFDKGR